MVVVWAVVLVIVVVMLGVMVGGDKWCDGGGGEWRCSVVDVVSCGGWWWPGAKVAKFLFRQQFIFGKQFFYR